MTEQYHVRLAKEAFVFSAAHFITFAGNICERLHGHNYKVAAEFYGPLDENAYVVDFIAARDALRKITGELDHHMLLPTEHPRIKVVADECNVTVTFEDRRWSFPREDCVLLPVANTTAELLARYIGQQLLVELDKQLRFRPSKLVIAVDECEGQWGVWEASDL